MIESFHFIIDRNTKALVIGSMPSIASLNAHEYYAHPRNLFWKFVFDAYNIDYDNPSYDEKLSLLLAHNIGLWDISKNCVRKGSLDTNIKSVVPNNFYSLTNSYPNILKFIFNGKKSFELFKKFYPELLLKKEFIVLPSTSPANASIPFETKKKLWVNQLISI